VLERLGTIIVGRKAMYPVFALVSRHSLCDLPLNFSIERGVKVADRRFVNRREFERGSETRGQPAGFVLRDCRDGFMPEQPSHVLLPEADSFPGDPEAIEMEVGGLSHGAFSA
jgi:hypothetical protein